MNNLSGQRNLICFVLFYDVWRKNIILEALGQPSKDINLVSTNGVRMGTGGMGA